MRSIHLIAHTHWDREWYHPASRFRARLVALVDALLARTDDPRAPFLLDGQAVVLLDYLDVRPERAERVRAALTTGAIEAGPWFVLADNLIPSGEAIVRNLAAGARAVARLGGRAPSVAYCPDTFGHPAALPTIAAGFGFPAAIVWRGFGGATHPATDTFVWRGASGAQLIAFHLPPDGYEFGSGLPNAAAEMRARWNRIRDGLSTRNHTGLSALTVGADHHAPPPDLAARVALMQETARECAADAPTITRTSLAAFGDALAALEASALPSVDGELRDSYGYTWTLQGTFATRAHQKRVNARLERLLLRECEPLSALAWLHGDDASREVSPSGVITLAQLPALLDHAWETLLRTHPHDTLCGCSIDAVADAMTVHQREVYALAQELRHAALDLALRHDAVHARSMPVDDSPMAVVYNGAGTARDGIATIVMREKVRDVPVGPQSGAMAVADAPLAAQAVESFVGGLQFVGHERLVHRRRESPQHYPDNDLVRERTALVWVPRVPAFGVRTLDVSASEPSTSEPPTSEPPTSEPPTMPLPATVHEERNGAGDAIVRLGNGLIALDASARGVTIRMGAREIVDALRLETIVDAGDTYTPSLRGEPERLALVDVRAVDRGPLRASVRLRWRWTSANRRERIAAETILSLDAGSAEVTCRVRGVNARRNQRLQLIWRTDVRAHVVDYRVVADAAFGPVDRTVAPSAVRVPGDAPFEQPPNTMPLHRWLSISDRARGAALISDGLAEGAAARGELAVTLVRSVGELSVSDTPERPGHAGWPVPTPLAQCLGPYRATLALLLHDAWSDATLLGVERAAERVVLPLRGETRWNMSRASGALSGPELVGEGLVASTVRVSDDGGTLVCRCVNVTGSPVDGAWQLPPTSAWRVRVARLDDTPLSDWQPVHHAHVSLHVPPHGVHTIHVVRDTSAFAS